MNKTITTRKLSILFWMIVSMMVQSMASHAQTRTITGTVVEASNSQPIPGATVKIKGESRGVTTNVDGVFTISASTGDVLVISFIGYTNKEVAVGSSNSVTVSLSEDIKALDEVVVVGYGTMKKTDMTSSQVTVTAADISRTVNTSLDQALQGRAANVVVTSNSGQPGAAPSVIIRGLSSLNGSNQPLYVIDGVQFKPDDSKTERPDNGRNAGNFRTSGVASNFLATMNPDDIETVNVLQGPSATAIYGAAGANGVVMITTKRGKSGETKINFNSLTTMQDLPRFSEVMNLREWATYRNAYADAGAASRYPEFADPSVLGEGTNWQEELFRQTLLQKNTLSLSGGNDKTTFYFSGEYFNQDGIAVGSGFKRYSTRLNLENQTRSWLKIGANVSSGFVREVVNAANGDIINTAIGQNPSVSVKNPDGSWGGPNDTQFQFTNPVALASINDDRNNNNSFNGGVNIDFTLFKGLVFHTDANGYLQNSKQILWKPSYTFGGFQNTTTESARSQSQNYWWGLNQRLQYQTQIRKHSINVMAAHEAQKNGWESLYGQRKGYLVNTNRELNAGSTINQVNNSVTGVSTKESYLGRVNYVFKDRYIVQGTFRADASSNFGENYRWGYFPSISTAWRVSEESFMKNIEVVDDLKLRVEYGWSGNENGANGVYATLTTIPTPFGGGTGFMPDAFPNPDLRWEIDKMLNLGFDLHLLKNRIEVVADYYIKDMSDLLVKNQQSTFLGGATSFDIGSLQWPFTNIGSMKNQGFGLTINTVNLDRKSVNWKTSFNISHDKNEVTALGGAPMANFYANSSFATLTEVGSPAALYTGYIAEGLFQNLEEIKSHAIQTSNAVLTVNPGTGTWVGDIKYRDLNKDGFINDQDRTVIGNPWPKFTLGFNNAVTYKNFDFNVFFYGSFGNDVVNYMRFRNEQTGGTAVYSNLFRSVANFARPNTVDPAATSAILTNPGYSIARIAPGDPNGNNRASQWFIEDGSYLRCRNIALAYNIPESVFNRINFIKGLKIGANVQNAFTITKYKGLDPEVGQNTSLIYGMDSGRYPTTRMYSLNLMANF